MVPVRIRALMKGAGMRSSYWDYWKGLAIIAVVLIHASNSTAQFPDNSFGSEFGIALRQFISYPVGLFVFLAAYFAKNSSQKDKSYIERVGSRIIRLLLPYLIWSAVYTAVRLATGNISPGEIPVALLNGNAVAVGYYVIVMIQLSLMSPVLEKLQRPVLVVLFLLSIIVSCVFTYTLRFGDNSSLWSRFPYSSLPFFVWLPFYVAGLLAADVNQSVWRKLPAMALWGAVILALGLSFIEAEMVLGSDRDLAVSQLKITSILYALSVCFLSVRWYRQDGDPWPSIFAWIGRRSFYFYLSHMLVLSPVQLLLRRVHGVYENQVVFVFMSGIATLIICSFGALIIETILRNHRAARRAIGME